MSIEGQGHFFTIYFPGFVCFALYWAKISGERLQEYWSSGLFFGSPFRLVNYFDSEIVRSLSAYFGKTRSEIGYTWPMVNANSIWKLFLKYERCPYNCKLQFHVHHIYFRKDLQMLLAAKEGEI